MCICFNSKHKRLEKDYQELQAQSTQKIADLQTKLSSEAADNRALQQKIAKLLNPPKLLPCGTIDYALVDAIVRAKVAEIEDKDYEVYIPDSANKVYNKADVIASQELEEVAAIQYVAETMDCDDFAAMLYGKFAGLIWTNAHAFNWFIDEIDTLWYIEPQTKKLSQTIEGWQGSDIRYFLGR